MEDSEIIEETPVKEDKEEEVQSESPEEESPKVEQNDEIKEEHQLYESIDTLSNSTFMKNSNVIQETEENKRDEIVTNEEQEQPKPLMPKKIESQAYYESFSNLSLGGSPSQPGSPSSSRSNSIIDFRHYLSNSSDANSYSIMSPEVLNSLDKNAQVCAKNVSSLMATLQTGLKEITTLSLENIQIYQNSVQSVTEEVDQSVAAMNTLIRKCSELNENMKPVEQLYAQIRDIKKALDVFEILAAKHLK